MTLKCSIPIALGRNQLETDTNDIYNTSPLIKHLSWRFIFSKDETETDPFSSEIIQVH